MGSTASHSLLPRLVDSMSDEEIAAEYARCRLPDGTLDPERMAEMARRVYGYELRESTVSEAEAQRRQRAWSEFMERWELLPEDPEPADHGRA